MTVSTGTFKMIEFSVKGIDCGSCGRDVEKALMSLPGVSDVSVYLDEAKSSVGFDASQVPAGALCAAVEEAGFEVPL